MNVKFHNLLVFNTQTNDDGLQYRMFMYVNYQTDKRVFRCTWKKCWWIIHEIWYDTIIMNLTFTPLGHRTSASYFSTCGHIIHKNFEITKAIQTTQARKPYRVAAATRGVAMHPGPRRLPGPRPGLPAAPSTPCILQWYCSKNVPPKTPWASHEPS